jgi:hypothetical protein
MFICIIRMHCTHVYQLLIHMVRCVNYNYVCYISTCYFIIQCITKQVDAMYINYISVLHILTDLCSKRNGDNLIRSAHIFTYVVVLYTYTYTTHASVCI